MTASASFSQDDIVLLEEASEMRPKPCVSNEIAIALVLDLLNFVCRYWLLLEALHLLRNSAQNIVHPDALVSSPLYVNTVAVEVDAVEVAGFVGEASSIEVTLDASDCESQVGRVYDLADFGVASISNIHTTKVWQCFIHSTLAHRRYEGWQSGGLDQLVYFVQCLSKTLVFRSKNV